MRKGEKKDKRTDEEKRADQLKFELSQIPLELINEPTILYQVGQKVNWGNHFNTVVTEVLHGGKIIKTHTSGITQVYGKDTAYETDSYHAWHNLTPIPEVQAKQLSYREDSYITFSNTTMESLFSKYYHFGVDMEPDYQRGLVWTLEDKVALIDSIFNNIEIGKFAFIFRGYGEDKMYEILDGKQRLNTIIEFYEGRFKYKGLTYHEMCIRDQQHFEGFYISTGESRNPMTQAQKYKYFLKMNTSGKAQSQEHLDKVKALLENTQEEK